MSTLTITDSKTFAVAKSLTLDGTDGTTMTFPSTSALIARTDAANTFAGTQTFSNAISYGGVTLTAAVTGTGKMVLDTAPTLDGVAVTSLLDISAASAGQIKFPATQNPSTNPNTLDDYEEGTWTPTITGSGGTPQASYLSRYGYYTKIGRLVHVSFWVRSNGVLSGPTGSTFIDGLPFVAGGAAGEYQSGTVGMYQNITLSGTGTTQLILTIFEGDAKLELQACGSATSWYNQAVSGWGGSGFVAGACSYIT